MSVYSYSAGELDRLESRLESLVQAFVMFDAARLGAAAKFGFGPTEIEVARGALAEFAEQLRNGLRGDTVQPEFRTLIDDIQRGPRMLSDWQADLEDLPQRLRENRPLDDQQREALQKALGFFRQEVAESANRIRNR